jgi:peptidoglycan hydrolase CwlO-like protein
MTEEPVVKKPSLPLDPKTMTRDQINLMRHNLSEHLEILLESLGHALNELQTMKESFELNPPKRKELEDAITKMDEEIEQVKKELGEYNRA